VNPVHPVGRFFRQDALDGQDGCYATQKKPDETSGLVIEGGRMI
jgi:hypothetical protein